MGGSGCPKGLKGDEIYLEARIACVADEIKGKQRPTIRSLRGRYLPESVCR
jgi:hypothetical protein